MQGIEYDIKLHLELSLEPEEVKFIIDNEKYRQYDDDKTDFYVCFKGKKVFRMADSFAFEIGDIIYRWLHNKNEELVYIGQDFVENFIEKETKWYQEILSEDFTQRKFEYAKYLLFGGGKEMILSYFNGRERVLMLVRNDHDKGIKKVVFSASMDDDELENWKKITDEIYLSRLERERKFISGEIPFLSFEDRNRKNK